MPNLSSKDKLALRVSAARIERWNRERLKPVSNDKPRCQSIVFGASQDKPEENILPDRLDSIHRMTDGCKVRTMAGKLSVHGNALSARVHTVAHMRGDGSYETQIVLDCPDNDGPVRDPAWKTGLPSVAKARPNSPFKRSGKAAASVVIVRKGKA